MAGKTAVPNGLYLSRVDYNPKNLGGANVI
jgi:hypothetical protein